MSVTLGEYHDVFLEEAEEQLETLNSSLLELEQNHEDISLINEIFRAAHSFKSSAAFVGLNHLSDLAHNMETLLQQVRDGEREITDEIIEVLFQCFDLIRTVVDLVSKGKSPDVDMSQIMNQLQAAIENKSLANSEKQFRATSGSKTAEKPPERQSKTSGISKPSAKAVDSKVNGSSKVSNQVSGRNILTNEEKSEISQGLHDGLHCYDLNLYFEEDTPALWVRIQLVFQQLDNIGRLIKTIPDVSQLNEHLSIRHVRVFLLTDEDEQSVFNTADVDQVEKVVVKEIRLKAGQNGAGRASSPPPPKQSLTQPLEAKSEVSKNIPEDEQPNPIETNSSIEADKGIAAQVIQRNMDELTKSISQTVKVPVKKLDELLNNVAELVIANSGFFQIYEEVRSKIGSSNTSTEFKNRIEQMTRIAKDLQAGIMNTRMIPIGTVFKRFQRLVRDLAREHGKEINLVLKGEETELDKKVIDSLGEPLLHLIRNSVDHGIEPTSEREQIGKDPAATIMLNAYQGGNRILVEVIDDGKGLNREKIKQKAIDKGLLNTTQLETMTEDDLYQLIFLPGFSTAEKVSDISGRGVGMNVVKEVVTEMNGNVTVETERGVGTKFTMTFPLTTAIIAAIMVRTSEELYAIPLSDVVETIKVSEEEISTIENHEVIYLRDDVLSLIRLDHVIGKVMRDDGTGSRKLPVVVVGFGNRKVGLVVDKLEGKQEIVIKSLEQNFRAVEGLSGASILGDGSIALILDVQAMINLAISNRAGLEEERYKQRMLAQQNRNKKVSAQEYFRDFGKDEKKTAASQPSVEMFDEPENRAGVSSEKASVAKDFGFGNNEQKADEEFGPSKSSLTKPEIFDEDDDDMNQDLADEETISEEHRQRIYEIQEDANRHIEAAAKSANVESILLQPEELLKLGDRKYQDMLDAAGLDYEDLDRIAELGNQGVKEAAKSLSQIVNKKVDMAIPQAIVIPVEDIGRDDQNVKKPYVTVILKMDGDIHGHILIGLMEEDAMHLVDLLYGMKTGQTMDLNEDAISALKEITNIVGSTLINYMGETLSIKIMPSVPELIHDFFSSTAESVVADHAGESDYALSLNTEFFISEEAVVGKIFMIPSHKSIKTFVGKLRSL